VVETSGRELLLGLAEPPAFGESALPPGTFADTVVLVTGGGTGLGKAIATEFGRLGATVAIASRDHAHVAAGCDAVADTGGRAVAVTLDVRDEVSVAAAFDRIEAAAGLPSVVVNNAAANFPAPAESLSPRGWRAVVDTTLTGTFLVCREFARRQLAAGRRGSIVNVGASYAWTGGPGFAHSAAAKAGVKALTETLAVEWAPYGLQVNAVVPGLMPHDNLPPAIRENLARAGDDLGWNQPALRVGEPRELAWAVTFLASPFARFIAGHTLVVDGANWQRRSLTNPPVRTVREQMGLGSFDPDEHRGRPGGGRP
jgi:NAD(P)-dependent dehydrogenase (short-subunit alcohol dehydrogenase family)